jgi:Na+(H+)/acetate symporter ActP
VGSHHDFHFAARPGADQAAANGSRTTTKIRYLLDENLSPIIPDFFGISAQGIGVVGMLLNFAVILVVSQFTPPPPAHIQDLVDSVRNPMAAGSASSH